MIERSEPVEGGLTAIGPRIQVRQRPRRYSDLITIKPHEVLWIIGEAADWNFSDG
jgi:hypothetical protein